MGTCLLKGDRGRPDRHRCRLHVWPSPPDVVPTGHFEFPPSLSMRQIFGKNSQRIVKNFQSLFGLARKLPENRARLTLTDIFFLLDPTQMHDVVDYWNLRAAGFRTFSLPVDCYKDYAERAKAFARWSMDPSVPKPFAGPTIVKARSVEDDVSIQAGISGLREPFVPGRNPSADVLHRWAERNHFVWLRF